MKIIKYEEGYLKFDNGDCIYSDPCNEYNDADFSQIDDLAKSWEFDTNIIFEKCDCGFRFGNPNKMVFVPCYSFQDGSYSTDLEIYYRHNDKTDAGFIVQAEVIE